MIVFPSDFEEPVEYNQNYILYWNHAGLEPTPRALQPSGRCKCGLGDPPLAPAPADSIAPAPPRPKSVTPKSTPTNIR